MLSGEGGIRTLGTRYGYGSLANYWFKPLTHLTVLLGKYSRSIVLRKQKSEFALKEFHEVYGDARGRVAEPFFTLSTLGMALLLPRRQHPIVYFSEAHPDAIALGVAAHDHGVAVLNEGTGAAVGHL